MPEKQKKMSVQKDYLNTYEVAEMLDVSSGSVRHYIRQGYLKAKETIDGYLIKRSDVEKFEKPKRTGRPTKGKKRKPSQPSKDETA